MLELANVARHFGGLARGRRRQPGRAAGTITGLIGPNGAGKSTLFAVAGELKPRRRGPFPGERIEGAPDRIFRMGLARTFQIPRPFPQMTVLENVMLAPIRQAGERFWNNWVRPGARARRGAPAPRARPRGAGIHRTRRQGAASRRAALRRPAKTARAGARDDGRSEADPARRAGGRRQSRPCFSC